MKGLNVASEIGVLKRVLLHRPGLELEHLTPKWLNQLLFDDIPWLKKAQEEHDEFKALLEKEGIEVVYLEDLVAESLINRKVVDSFVDQFISESAIHNPHAIKRLKTYLLSLDKKSMVKEMMSGIPKSKLKGKRAYSLKERIEEYPFFTDPMPNLYFTRDPFSIILDGVSIHKMYSNVRNRETIFGEYIFKYHPDYQSAPKYYDRNEPSSLEGGDILVLNHETIAIGISERTDPDAIETLANRLFTNTDIKTIVAIDMPKKRAFMHLDTVLTQVDHCKFVVHHDFLGKKDIFIITQGSKINTLKIEKKTETIKRVFSRVLKNAITMLPCGGDDPIASDREQWNDGANTLAIAPGVVIVYERNTISNKLLVENGIKIIPIKASELSRGRGGPRCMSMPLIRASLE
ncbi:MAG: arginine deiminase [Acholeplasma sp.]|nr:arginine deiminase [Acholeplasma sp.]